MCVPASRKYFKDKGRDILSSLYQNYHKVANVIMIVIGSYDHTQDTSTLIQHYDDLLDYTENNISDVVEELKQRGVLCMCVVIQLSLYEVYDLTRLIDAYNIISNLCIGCGCIIL